MQVNIHTRQRESSQKSDKHFTKFRVILIQEGLGNLKDCFYYTNQALQNAATAKLFEGKKCYADHPSSLEEQILPERSTRDIIGFFEDVKFENVESGGALTANLCIDRNDPSAQWAISRLNTALEYSKNYNNGEFIGLSINASGEAKNVPIVEFISDFEIPDNALPKLQLAASEGINELRVVSQLNEAVSCDLVTEAGAGGKVLKMIEGKKTMKSNKRFKENEDQETKKEALPPQGKGGDKGDDKGKEKPHDDEKQDVDLFQKMVKQYLGDEHAEDSEAHGMAKEAYEAYQSEGMNEDEAYEAAGNHLKMAKKIGMKMAKQTEAFEDESKKKENEDSEKPNKESKKIVTLSAEVAKLKESVTKYELRDYLESKLAKSKRPNSITKAFREALGMPKSKYQIDQMYDLFMKAVDTSAEEFSTDTSVFFTEKQSRRPDSNEKNNSFSDCVD
jgi:hypothetical protein